ncbi:MAG: hypothetical protein PHS44_04420 [Candidatus Dojkabacteria bacterium]|nr:hypothetical protein [Candidatus Dojkabacteria bacterium]
MLIYQIKTGLGTIGIVLTFVGYIPYIRDIIKGKTKPHAYSWFVWSLATYISFALQISDKAGIGSIITVSAATISFVIFILGLKVGKKYITKSDKIFLISALVALAIWIFAKQPVLSAILISATELLGYIPTIRKSWNNPYTETLSTYLSNTFRHTLGFISLTNYSILTWSYPVTWVIANGVFSAVLIIRRKQTPKPIRQRS